MVNRLIGLDYGRGLAVIGLFLSHSVMGTICGWNVNALFDLAAKTPIILVVLLFVPVAIMGLMGSLFSFITAICVTISSIKIKSKGWGSLARYCVMKVIFAFMLKGLEDFWNGTLSDYNMFQTGRIQFPSVSIKYWAHTLDTVGFFSWAIPVIVAGITSIPKMHYYGHMAILTVMGVVLMYFNEYLVTLCTTIAEWSLKNELFMLHYLFMKGGDGAFAIAQYLPYGLIGGAYGIMFTKTRSFKVYWTYTGILSVILLAGAIRFAPFEEDIMGRSFGWIKPHTFLFVMGIVQAVAMIIVMHFTDNPARDINKRYSAIKKTTFLRRINCLSLTAYIVEAAYNGEVYRIFKVFFGEGADTDAGVFKWHWVVALLFMICCVWLWCALVKLWEKADFRFSVEVQLSHIMSWLFNQPYNKMDFKNAIYGPINEIQKEIEDLQRSKQDVEIPVIVEENQEVEIENSNTTAKEV